MRIDFDNLRTILSTFLDSPASYITIKNLGFYDLEGADRDKLAFHLLLLVENRLISDLDLNTGHPEYIGLVYAHGRLSGGEVPIRLTQDGHDFAKVLNEKPVLERIKKDLTDAPFDLVKEIGKKWLTQLIEQKLGIK
jgi:hypothetical protein